MDLFPTVNIDANKGSPARESSPRFDGWANFFTGLGSMNDKSRHTRYGTAQIIDDETLAQIYTGDGLGGRIIDIVADDMTREWVYLHEDEDENGQKLIDEFRKLAAEETFNKAIKWQRLFGGSLIIVGAMDGQSPDKPLRLNRVKTIEYLKVVDRTEIPLTECIFDTNPASSTFGQVQVYKINYLVGSRIVPMYVHASRVIPFYNDPVPSRMKTAVDYSLRHWGMSSLQRIYEELRDLGGITQSTVNILMEFIIGKFKIDHLAEMLAAGQEEKVIKRIEIMNRSKSVVNAVLLGENEEYTRDYATLAGLPEVIDRFMLKLSGSTGIPVTRLFGRSPAGLNATGENDLRNYYDLIEANQRNRLQTPLLRLIEIMAGYLGISDIPRMEFNPLYQLSEDERAKVDNVDASTAKIKAETEMIYVNMGARDVEDVSDEYGWEPPEELPEEPEPDEENPNIEEPSEDEQET